MDDLSHQQLDDQLLVYFDTPSERFVFYDFENDVGVSVSRSEWARTTAWASSLTLDVRSSVNRSLPRAPVRYPGGKWLIARWIIGYFPPHVAYVEPFGGGASVLLQKPEAGVETYNDLDDDVVNFFRVLRDNPDELVRAIDLSPFARSEYDAAWERSGSPVERARRFYVRSWQARGMGESAVETAWRRVRKPSRWRAPSQEWGTTEQLYWAADRLRRVQIEREDAFTLIERYDDDAVLMYLDPPYVPETLQGDRSDRAYRFGMAEDGHVRLAEMVAGLRSYVVLSGYPCQLYSDLYEARGWRRVERSAQVNNPDTRRTEALWLCPRTVAALDRIQPRLV
jgi:DNA adenine methylase